MHAYEDAYRSLNADDKPWCLIMSYLTHPCSNDDDNSSALLTFLYVWIIGDY